MVKEGLINRKKDIIKGIIREATPELKSEANKLAGLKKYLLDYKRIKDREIIEVHLFEEYLILAQIMGITNKVAKQFEKIYPNIIEQSNFLSYSHILFINTTCKKWIVSAKSSKSNV